MEENENFLVSFCDNCRMCLQVHQQMTPIQSLKQSNDFNTLLTFFNVEVMMDTRYPNKICIVCLNQLSDIILFKQNCESVRNYLNNILNDTEFQIRRVSYDTLIKIEVPEDSDFNQNNTIDEKFPDTTDETINKINKDIKTTKTDTADIPDTSSFSTINNHLKSEDCEDESNENSKSPAKSKTRACVKCPCCQKVFDQLYYHRKHQAIHLKKPFKCDHCPRLFENKEILTSHLRKHIGLNPFKCTECSRAYRQKWGLIQHKRFVHNGDPPKFTCNECGQVVQHLKTHIRYKHRPHKFECTYCNKKFAFRGKLVTHVRDYHENCDESFVVLCPLCGKKFRRNSDLKRHNQSCHSNELNYKCRHCDTRFKTCSRRFKHEKTHLDVRPFECTYCARTFVEKHTLETHIRIHTGEKPFSCDICSRSFRQKTTLQTHIKLVHGRALNKK